MIHGQHAQILRCPGVSVFEPARLDDWNLVVAVVVVKDICVIKVVNGFRLLQLVHCDFGREVLSNGEDYWHSDVFCFLAVAFEKSTKHKVSAILKF